jgi:hypothetical protein
MPVKISPSTRRPVTSTRTRPHLLARTTIVNPSATPDETFVDSVVRALHSAGAKHQAR